LVQDHQYGKNSSVYRHFILLIMKNKKMKKIVDEAKREAYII